MAPQLILDVFHKGRVVYSDVLSQQVELGRLRGDESKDQLFAKQPVGNGFRVAIVEPSEASVSRQHVLLQRISGNRIRITNITTTNFVRVGDDNIVAGESRELTVPAKFVVGTAEIRVGEEPELQSLAGTDTIPGEAIQLSEKPLAAALLKLPDEQAEPVIEWLDSIVRVLQSAASSSDFYEHATQALVKLVGLDSGRVLMRKGNHWEQKSQEITPFASDEDCDAAPSNHILGSLLREKRTVWSDPENSAFDMEQSLVGVQAVVAAPIFDRHGEVIGALYGDRHFRTRSSAQTGMPQISRAEAMLVKILAASVAAGLARVEQEQAATDQEQAAVAARALFGQFFTPELSDKLASDPHMLSGRDTEVTLLFCDIRDFSGISQRLDPSVTMDWIGDVIGVLSDCVINHQGVLVDYVGDELLAMWGAPSEQADQALLACRAALAMQNALPTLNERWQSRMGKPFRIGVGINTGTARVGNIGSHRKMKYGPLGNTVNMASRVQGMTKYLKSEILITAATRARLNSEFMTRRLCQVRVVNIATPVELYELQPQAEGTWKTLQQHYEEALEEFEKQNFRNAAGVLSRLISQFPEDGPSLILLSRAVALLIAGAEYNPSWDPTWVPPGK
ncbi:MAG TPA: adenylate/guanylate cyclase domain-containing protein [Pirellulales bacterium]|nr:adenylate/guanylate cyclase domain-containing protein [Pirellulales bacterium]